MPTHIVGSLHLADGTAPRLYYTVRDGSAVTLLAGNGAVSFHWQCTLAGGHLLLELDEVFERYAVPLEEVFWVGRHLIDSVLLGAVVAQGVGLAVTVEHLLRPDGTVVAAPIDRIPDPETLPCPEQALFSLIGSDELLRLAIRDFNAGLLDRDLSPVLFYRCVESLAKVVVGSDHDLRPAAWSDFHARVGTQREEMRLLEERSPCHRHGTRERLTPDEHREILRQTHYVLGKVIAYLATQAQNALPAE